MTGTELGIGHDPLQHSAYVKSWIKILKDDPKEILIASKDAEKITNLVLSYENEKSQSKDSELSDAFKRGINEAISPRVVDYNNPYHPSSPEFKDYSNGFQQTQKILSTSLAEKFSENFKTEEDKTRFIEQVQKQFASKQEPVKIQIKETQSDLEAER